MYVDCAEYDITAKSFYFSGDASYGSFKYGVVTLTLDTQTGITNVVADEEEATWYDLSGRKLNGKPTTKGLFIKNGKKESCWIWYIFPQVKGLGSSMTSEEYGIKDIEEVELYFTIINNNTYETIYDSDIFTLKF